ncbi:MAG: 50S ribosomal protein L21 [Oligoflexales bacterium]|nr:50S ribosomal protein L21 [Oligoflexales bacterium]
MYAVIQASGHQFRVKEGDLLSMDHFPGKKEGESVVFDKVLMIAGRDDVSEPLVGAPFLEKARVEATIESFTRGDKVIVFKYKRRKNHKKTRGHRQQLSVVRVNKIEF